jgi:hypothetical protein
MRPPVLEGGWLQLVPLPSSLSFLRQYNGPSVRPTLYNTDLIIYYLLG